MSIAFTPEILAQIEVLLTQYPEGRSKSALLPVLHLAQKEFGGWLSTEAMDYVADLLGLHKVEVYEVATFYTMFHLKKTGKYVLEVCRTGPCCLVGAEDVIAEMERILGIAVGESTPDGLFTLKTVECLASCGSGPVLQLGDRYLEKLSLTRIRDILADMKSGRFSFDHVTDGEYRGH